MASKLDDWALDTLASHVSSKKDLCSLRLVSRRFHDIFTPYLYRQIQLCVVPWSQFELLCHKAKTEHLKYTHNLYLHVDGFPEENEDSPGCLDFASRMGNLRSFSVVGTMASNLANSLIDYSEKESSAITGFRKEFDEQDIRQQRTTDPLATLSRIKELSVVNLDCLAEKMGPLPLLSNLHELVFTGMIIDGTANSINNIGEMIICSPHLKRLGLSAIRDSVWFDKAFRMLINYCDEERTKRKIERVKLSRLHLGLGLLPQYFHDSVHDHVSKLTDPSAVEVLRIDNFDKIPEQQHRQPYSSFDPPQLSGMKNLRRISVDRLSSDVAILIHECVKSQTTTKLCELDISLYLETCQWIRNEEIVWDNDDSHFSINVEDLQLFHWRKISIGTFIRYSSPVIGHVLQNFIIKCKELEELAIPMAKEHFDLFSNEVWPALPKLRTLLLIGDSSVVERQKRGESEELLGLRTHNFAVEVFKANRVALKQHPEITPLRFFGLQATVYSCVLANPSNSVTEYDFEAGFTTADGEITRHRVFKLSPEESFSFKPLRRESKLYWNAY